MRDVSDRYQSMMKGYEYLHLVVLNEDLLVLNSRDSGDPMAEVE